MISAGQSPQHPCHDLRVDQNSPSGKGIVQILLPVSPPSLDDHGAFQGEARLTVQELTSNPLGTRQPREKGKKG